MIEYTTRAAILELTRRGNGPRAIARALGVSRNTVRKVLDSGVAEVPPLDRAGRLDAHVDFIRELHADGTTIFLVEQNAHMALKVAQHFYLLDQGRVTFSGTPGQVAEDEVIQRAYLGSGGSD